jgi:hypothetical protein
MSFILKSIATTLSMLIVKDITRWAMSKLFKRSSRQHDYAY